jgi:flagellar motor switch protein FliN/FliY
MAETAKPDETQGGLQAPDEFARFQTVPLTVRIDVGRRTMKVRDILTLRRDSVFDLPKSAGENVEVVVNGALLGYGEVVETEGKAGIRITDLYEPN